eukprot:2804493-Amphidinium_carterae.1
MHCFPISGRATEECSCAFEISWGKNLAWHCVPERNETSFGTRTPQKVWNFGSMAILPAMGQGYFTHLRARVIEPEASRMLGGCDTTTPRALP